jgi:hypothetical protein
MSFEISNVSLSKKIRTFKNIEFGKGERIWGSQYVLCLSGARAHSNDMWHSIRCYKGSHELFALIKPDFCSKKTYMNKMSNWYFAGFP